MSTQMIHVEKNNLVSVGGRAVINPLKSRILGEVLKEANTLVVKKYKVLKWELNEPDYQWLCYFAGKIECGVEETMKLIMENEGYYELKIRTEIENGSFTSLNLESWGLSEEDKKECECGEIEDDLNFYGLKKLKHIDCSSNCITSLDVSCNTQVRSLNCSWNQLTSLDVSNNIELENLICSGNYLSSLDVSNNIELKHLYCRYNELTNLDISNNVELRELRYNDRFIRLSKVNAFLIRQIQTSNETSLKLILSDLAIAAIDIEAKTGILTLSSGALLNFLKTKKSLDWITSVLENEFGWKLHLTARLRESKTRLFENDKLLLATKK